MEHDAELTGGAAAPRTGVVPRVWGGIATILSVVYTAILLAAAALVARFKRGHYVSPLMRLWAWLIFHTCAISAEVEGLEHLRGLGSFILISNHQSLFDIIAIVHLLPCEVRFVAKQELRRVPLLGYVLARSGNIMIERQSGGRAIRRAVAATRDGYSIAVFAEGRRSSDNRVHEFSDGGAWLALATGRPCVPLAISGTLAMMPRGARFALAGRRIRLAFGQPIATAELRSADRARLSAQLERSVRELFRSEV
ncbi:MAG TPA: lysophospholipid acyltransferase family protein [Candidatus Binataceae bacterium]|nr:lysophospholipid acyltransferase family protein [Candidatus Binataceae bacterium]